MLRFRFSIATKLILTIFFLLLVTVIPLTHKILNVFELSTKRNVEEQNLNISLQKNQEIESLLQHLISRSKTLATLMLQNDQFNSEQSLIIFDSIFQQEKEIFAFEIFKVQSGYPQLLGRKIQTEIWKQHNYPLYLLDNLNKSTASTLVPAAQGQYIFDFVFDSETKNNFYRFGFPLRKNNLGFTENFMVIYLKEELISKLFHFTGKRVSFLTNIKGQVLYHPKSDKTISEINFSNHQGLQQMLTDGADRRQFKYTSQSDKNATPENYLLAYVKNELGFVVFTEVAESSVLINSQVAEKEALRYIGLIMSVMILCVFLFSMTLSQPLEELTALTAEIAEGKFNVSAKDKVHSRDEVGSLAVAIDNMVLGLKERDRVKTLFNKFHDSSVTKEILSRENILEGANKNVCVFFSDLRGFTAFSEGHSPEDVVIMLNEYFSVMVETITANHGIVDKFIGDAIMAVWGAPQTTGQDSYWCIKACLEMRLALNELNQSRIQRGLVPMMMGMGVHTGPVISGAIGSEKRMEYTVIGDTVNQSSRIESSTKTFGTDLLVSEETADQIQNQFVVELAGDVQVKGKTEALKLFKIKGFKNSDGSIVEIKTPYSEYGIENPDLQKAG